MKTQSTLQSIEHPFGNVNPSLNTQLPLFPDSMIHHKDYQQKGTGNYILYRGNVCRRYGVSSSNRYLTRGVFIKKYDRVRDFLAEYLELTPAQREVVLRLLRLWAYYGVVYPKESQVTELPGCSKATFWRTVRLLQDMGLLEVVNRYLVRPHAQISNLYHLHKLLILMANLVGHKLGEKYPGWIEPFLEYRILDLDKFLRETTFIAS